MASLRGVCVLLFSVAGLGVWAGCAADGTDSKGDDAVHGTPTAKSPSSPSSSEDPPADHPDFDASFPGDPPPATPPPSGDECIDKDDVGSSENVAKKLATIDDHDSSGGHITGVMNGPVDVDFYKFEGDDTWTGTVDPTVSSGTTGLEVCMFVACMNGPVDFKGCSGGTMKNSDIGNPGCCVATPGTTTLDYNCVGTTSESANVFIRVKQVADKCLPYSLDYHF
jgi:hypothetical protein